MKRLSLILAMLALGGCSMFTEYRALKAIAREGIATAIEDRKSWNDSKGAVVLALPCDMSLGAAMRLESERQKAILIELCGGPAANSAMTVEDVTNLMLALQGKPLPAPMLMPKPVAPGEEPTP